MSVRSSWIRTVVRQSEIGGWPLEPPQKDPTNITHGTLQLSQITVLDHLSRLRTSVRYIRQTVKHAWDGWILYINAGSKTNGGNVYRVQFPKLKKVANIYIVSMLRARRLGLTAVCSSFTLWDETEPPWLPKHCFQFQDVDMLSNMLECPWTVATIIFQCCPSSHNRGIRQQNDPCLWHYLGTPWKWLSHKNDNIYVCLPVLTIRLWTYLLRH